MHAKYATEQSSYGTAVAFPEELLIDESKMSVWINFVDGNRRDGVGDLVEIGGIDLERHRKNAVVMFDHAKNYKIPIAMSYERDEQGKYNRDKYTVELDLIAKQGRANDYFYQGRGMPGLHGDSESDHALFCEQMYDMVVKRMLGAGSIGYQEIQYLEIPPDYRTGTPAGKHLIRVRKLEHSLVVMPCNMDTVMKMLDTNRCCGKTLSPILYKSLDVHRIPRKAQLGYEKKNAPPHLEGSRVRITEDGQTGTVFGVAGSRREYRQVRRDNGYTTLRHVDGLEDEGQRNQPTAEDVRRLDERSGYYREKKDLASIRAKYKASEEHPNRGDGVQVDFGQGPNGRLSRPGKVVGVNQDGSSQVDVNTDSGGRFREAGVNPARLRKTREARHNKTIAKYDSKGLRSGVQAMGRWLAKKWEKLESRYGRKAALAMAVAGIATLPVPGNLTAIVGIAEGIRGLHGYFRGNIQASEHPGEHAPSKRSEGTCEVGQRADLTGCTPGGVKSLASIRAKYKAEEPTSPPAKPTRETRRDTRSNEYKQDIANRRVRIREELNREDEDKSLKGVTDDQGQDERGNPVYLGKPAKPAKRASRPRPTDEELHDTGRNIGKLAGALAIARADQTVPRPTKSLKGTYISEEERKRRQPNSFAPGSRVHADGYDNLGWVDPEEEHTHLARTVGNPRKLADGSIRHRVRVQEGGIEEPETHTVTGNILRPTGSRRGGRTQVHKDLHNIRMDYRFKRIMRGKSTEQKSESYKDGFRARLASKKRGENPHPEGTPDRTHWDSGFDDAHKEVSKESAVEKKRIKPTRKKVGVKSQPTNRVRIDPGRKYPVYDAESVKQEADEGRTNANINANREHDSTPAQRGESKSIKASGGSSGWRRGDRVRDEHGEEWDVEGKVPGRPSGGGAARLRHATTGHQIISNDVMGENCHTCKVPKKKGLPHMKPIAADHAAAEAAANTPQARAFRRKHPHYAPKGPAPHDQSVHPHDTDVQTENWGEVVTVGEPYKSPTGRVVHTISTRDELDEADAYGDAPQTAEHQGVLRKVKTFADIRSTYRAKRIARQKATTWHANRMKVKGFRDWVAIDTEDAEPLHKYPLGSRVSREVHTPGFKPRREQGQVTEHPEGGGVEIRWNQYGTYEHHPDPEDSGIRNDSAQGKTLSSIDNGLGGALVPPAQQGMKATKKPMTNEEFYERRVGGGSSTPNKHPPHFQGNETMTPVKTATGDIVIVPRWQAEAIRSRKSLADIRSTYRKKRLARQRAQNKTMQAKETGHLADGTKG